MARPVARRRATKMARRPKPRSSFRFPRAGTEDGPRKVRKMARRGVEGNPHEADKPVGETGIFLFGNVPKWDEKVELGSGMEAV